MDSGVLAEILERALEPGPSRLELARRRPTAPRRLGLVPGSFDPMTVAHAALAEALGADLTLFVWSPATLRKEEGPGGVPSRPLLAPEDRLGSLLAFCEGRPATGLAVCSHGLLADQAEAAARAFPGTEITFGVGSDKLLQLFDPAWYEDMGQALERLFSRARIAYAVRAGDEPRVAAALSDAALSDAGPWLSRTRRLELGEDVSVLSSRAVRDLWRRRRDVRRMVPPEVLPFMPEAG